jgi:hypothetical protein
VRIQAGAVAAGDRHQLFLQGLQSVDAALLGYPKIQPSAVAVFCCAVVELPPHDAVSGWGHILANRPKVRLLRHFGISYFTHGRGGATAGTDHQWAAEVNI